MNAGLTDRKLCIKKNYVVFPKIAKLIINSPCKISRILFKSNLNLAIYFYFTIYFTIQDCMAVVKLVRRNNN